MYVHVVQVVSIETRGGHGLPLEQTVVNCHVGDSNGIQVHWTTFPASITAVFM